MLTSNTKAIRCAAKNYEFSFLTDQQITNVLHYVVLDLTFKGKGLLESVYAVAIPIVLSIREEVVDPVACFSWFCHKVG